MEMYQDKFVVGGLELCDLPDLNITNLNVRVDTGAATSSLHVDNIEEFKRDGATWIRFDIHPDIHDVKEVVRRELKVRAMRVVKSSSAFRERRYMVETLFRLGGQQWRIKLTLTDRSEMSYLMLLGRQAMKKRIVVDPSREYLLGRAKHD